MKFTLALACLLLPLIAAPAFATDVQIACAAPTKFTDGTTITGAITYKFYGAMQGQPKVLLNATARTSCANTWASAPTGNVCADVTASVGGIESAHSAESCIAVAAPTPNAPGAPTLTLAAVGPTAYTLIKSKDRFVALPVGTIPLGTPCDNTQPVLGFYVVPVDAVKWSGTVRTLAALASCG